jgi:protein ImuA
MYNSIHDIATTDILYKNTVFTELTMSTAMDLEAVHPSLWRASQLARSHTRCIDTGHPSLSNQLPGGGWPVGTLIDLLVQQPGVGEMRLLAPTLAKVAPRRVVLLTPPHAPQALALAALGIPPQSALWLRADRTADALWAAEQILRSGSCGALLFWPGQTSTSSARQGPVRADSLRRLHLAAQQGETLFFNFRSLASEVDASPAPLRLSVRPAPGGINIGFVKRQGPQRDEPLFLPMSIGPAHVFRPGREVVPQLPKTVPAPVSQAPQIVSATLVGTIEK